jgi:hypothetical protein
MAEMRAINIVASYDEDMRGWLQEFCRRLIELGELIDKEIGLSVKMNWFEKHVSWLPFTDKDRIREYQKCVTRDRRLRESIPLIYDEICFQLDFLISSLEEAVKNTDRGQNEDELAAVNAVLEVFKEFDHKFRCYNWFLRFGRNESQTSFRDRYPDAWAVYQQALSGTHN